MGKNKNNHITSHWIFTISVWTFILALVLGFVTQLLFSRLYSLLLSYIILLAVIILGIFFDLIGTAAAAADIAPLNAKAARKVPGARRSVFLVQHAEQVANFCSDVVGDISGIVSGTLLTLIVFRLVQASSKPGIELYASIVMTALVAALTVGGKAFGKKLAISHSTEIMLLSGKIMDRLNNPFRRTSGVNDPR